MVNNAHSHANTDSDEQINVGNQAIDVQAESMFADSSEMNNHPRLLNKNYQFNLLLIECKSIQSIMQLI